MTARPDQRRHNAMRIRWSLIASLFVVGCSSSGSSAAGSIRPQTTLASTPSIPAPPTTGESPSPEGSVFGSGRIFGANDDQCPSTSVTIVDWPEAEDLVLLGQECFERSVNAGFPVIWDLAVPTVEGDPIFTRHLYDGNTVWLLRDNRADRYGSPKLEASKCEGYGPTRFGLDGLGCKPSDYPGFTGFAEAD